MKTGFLVGAMLELAVWPNVLPAAGPTITKAAPAPEWKWVEFTAAAGQSITLASDKAALWLTTHAGVLTPWPDGKGAIFSTAVPGDYRLWAVTADGATPVLVRVTNQPTPPPGPKPPPTPNDPLRERLRAAYEADPAPAAAKSETRKDLAELYRQAARLTLDDSVKTAGDLLGRVRKAAETIAPGALVGVRKVVAEELVRVLPADAAEELTPTHRKAAADLFGRLAVALDSF